MSAEKAGLEGIFKGVAAAIATGVSLVYLCGYLSLRQQITTLGIPAEFNVFDERYLYAGASYAVFLAQALAEMGLVLLPTIAAVLVLRVVVLGFRNRRKELWTPSELFPSITPRSKGWVVSLAAIACFGALRSIIAARPWTNLHDLLYEPKLDPGVASVLTGRGAEWYAIFKLHLAASLICAVLAVVAARSQLAKPWGLAALAVVAVQFISLPLLFGALTADRVKPKLRFANGETGLLVWEDKELWMYLRTEPPPAVIRKPKSPGEAVTITGYEHILCAHSPGGVCP